MHRTQHKTKLPVILTSTGALLFLGILGLFAWVSFRNDAFERKTSEQTHIVLWHRQVTLHTDFSSETVEKKTIYIGNKTDAGKHQTLTFKVLPNTQFKAEHLWYGQSNRSIRHGKTDTVYKKNADKKKGLIIRQDQIPGAPMQVALQFPGLSTGETLHYRIRLRQPAMTRRKQFSTVGQMGALHPAKEIRFSVQAPADIALHTKIEHLADNTAIEHVDGLNWVSKNVPAAVNLQDSPLRSSAPQIVVTTFSSWSQVANLYSERYFLSDHRLSQTLSKTAAQVERKTQTEKINQLFYLVSQMAQRNFSNSGSLFFPASPEATLTSQSGDCKDKAALLTALLRAAKIQAHPLLLSQGQKPLEDLAPAVQRFSHAVVFVPSLGLILDPTKHTQVQGPIPDYALLLDNTRSN